MNDTVVVFKENKKDYRDVAKYENAPTNNVNWLDARLWKPESNSYDKYLCVVNYCGLPMLRLVGWKPEAGYKDGNWDLNNDTIEVMWWTPTKFNVPFGIDKDSLYSRLLD